MHPSEKEWGEVFYKSQKCLTKIDRNVSKILVLDDFEFAAGADEVDLNLLQTQHNALARRNREAALQSTHAILFDANIV